MRLKIEMEIELPDVPHTEEQLEEFIRFEASDNGSIDGDNPFYAYGCSIVPIFGTLEYEVI